MQLHLVIEDSREITRDTCWFAFRRCPNLCTITIDGQVWSWLGLGLGLGSGLANPNPTPTPTPTPTPNPNPNPTSSRSTRPMARW